MLERLLRRTSDVPHSHLLRAETCCRTLDPHVATVVLVDRTDASDGPAPSSSPFFLLKSPPSAVCSVANAQQTQYTSTSRTIRSPRQMCHLVLACAHFSLVISQLCSCCHVCILSSPIQLPETELQGNGTLVSNRYNTYSLHGWRAVVFILLWNTHAPDLMSCAC